MLPKKNAFLIILALILLIVAGGLFLYNQKTDPEEKSGRINGIAADAQTGFPLQDVKVTVKDEEGNVLSDSGSKDVTGEDGIFTLELPPGKYLLHFEAENYRDLDSTAAYTVEQARICEIEEPFRLIAENSETTGTGSKADSGLDTPVSVNDDFDARTVTESSGGKVPSSGNVSGEPSVVSYMIQCVDKYGNLLDSYQQEGMPGTSMTIQAPSMTGYYPVTEELTFTLAANASDNTVRFVYEYAEYDDEYEALEDDPDYEYEIPGDAIIYNGHSYYAYETAAVDTFEGAKKIAESMGGYLAIINDSEENMVLYDYVMYEMNLKSAYFGLTDENANEWYWVDGSSVTYSHWGLGQPDNLRGMEHYALFYYKDKAYDWNDGDFGKDPQDGTVIFLIEWDY